MKILLEQTAIFVEMARMMADFNVVLLVLKHFVPASRRVSVRIIDDEPDFPFVAIKATVFLLQSFHRLIP